MEKEDALQRANTKLTPNSFIAVMRPTGVYKRFFLVMMLRKSITKVYLNNLRSAKMGACSP